MKRYLIFAGRNFNPCGGWNDFIRMVDDRPNLDDVLTIIGEIVSSSGYREWSDSDIDDMRNSSTPMTYTWMHMVDTETREIILKEHWD